MQLRARRLSECNSERATALTKRNRLATGVTRFLADVDVEQMATQMATLTTVKAGIATHRATLAT